MTCRLRVEPPMLPSLRGATHLSPVHSDRHACWDPSSPSNTDYMHAPQVGRYGLLSLLKPFRPARARVLGGRLTATREGRG
jgi:hypothetical protein